jgi:hypothetical protein
VSRAVGPHVGKKRPDPIRRHPIEWRRRWLAPPAAAIPWAAHPAPGERAAAQSALLQPQGRAASVPPRVPLEILRNTCPLPLGAGGVAGRSGFPRRRSASVRPGEANISQTRFIGQRD